MGTVSICIVRITYWNNVHMCVSILYLLYHLIKELHLLYFDIIMNVYIVLCVIYVCFVGLQILVTGWNSSLHWRLKISRVLV